MQSWVIQKTVRLLRGKNASLKIVLLKSELRAHNLLNSGDFNKINNCDPVALTIVKRIKSPTTGAQLLVRKNDYISTQLSVHSSEAETQHPTLPPDDDSLQ